MKDEPSLRFSVSEDMADDKFHSSQNGRMNGYCHVQTIRAISAPFPNLRRRHHASLVFQYAFVCLEGVCLAYSGAIIEQGSIS